MWVLFWLAGLAALGYIGATRSVTNLERVVRDNVQRAVAPLSNTPVMVSVAGYVATLSGAVPSAEERISLIGAASTAMGVRKVVNNLTVAASDGVATGNELDRDSGSRARLDAPTDAKQPSAATADATTTLIEERSAVESEPGSTATQAELPKQQSTVKQENQPAAAEVASAMPRLSLSVNGTTLVVTGTLSRDDDVSTMVQAAMSSFSLDHVSNKLVSDSKTKPAEWLKPLTEFLPTLQTLNNPKVNIIERQIMLEGTTTDTATHDKIIQSALASLRGFALVERISVNPRLESAANLQVESATSKPMTEPKADTPQSEPVVEPKADTPQSEPVVEPKADTPQSEPVVEPKADTPQSEPVAEAKADTPQLVATPTNETKVETISEKLDTPQRALRKAFNALPITRILFKSGSNVLTDESLDGLDQIASLLRQYPAIPVAISGHTDATGPDDINLLLSQTRANTVRDYLIDRGVTQFQLTAYGFGEGVPIADNNTSTGRRINRRIEFNF